MSLIIKVGRPGAAGHRLLELRGLHTVIGEDRHGVLSRCAPEAPFFSVVAIDNRYLLVTEREGFSGPGGALAAGTVLVLQNKFTLRGEDYQFEFFPISVAAEILARADQQLAVDLLVKDVDLSLSPRLSYRVMDLSRSFLLPPRLPLTIGSSEEDAIFIDLPGIANAHCRVLFDDGVVRLTPLHGAVRSAGGQMTGGCAFEKDGKFVLDPVGIMLAVTFPKAEAGIRSTL